MNTKKIKTTILMFATAAFTTFGMVACDKNTEPGETNVGRGDIREEGEIIDDNAGDVTRNEANEDPERFYNDADHENHEENEGEEVLGDGAYDGKGDGLERDEVQ